MSKDNCREMQASISIKHESDVEGGEQTNSINYNYHNKWFNSGENFLGEIKCKRTFGHLQQSDLCCVNQPPTCNHQQDLIYKESDCQSH